MDAGQQATTRRAVLGSLAAGAVGGCLGSGERQLEIGVVPDVDPDAAVERNEPLAEYLAERLDVETELRATSDYASLVRAMASDQLDLAYFGGVSYVLAHRRAGAEAIVVGSEDGSTEWHSVFVAHESAGVADLDDLAASAADLDLALGDPLSTSGSVMPSHHLAAETGLDPERDFASVTHVGAHDAVLRTVRGGNSDVGALNARIYDARADGDDADGDVEVWRTPGFADYPWAVSSTLEAETVDDLRAAFTSLDDEGRGDVLDRQNVDRYVPADHGDFAALESAVEETDLVDDRETNPKADGDLEDTDE